MENSSHLSDIVNKHNSSVDALIVVLDIEKYSMRKSSTQRLVLDSFTSIVRGSLNEFSKNNIEYAQSNGINFSTDIIKISTGDGLIAAFTFQGLHSAHLDFAMTVLRAVNSKNCDVRCEKFEREGWCNCHPNFNVRSGVSEGKCIVFKDINDNYNVAGNPVNYAARLIGLAGSMQILVTEGAYMNLVDMSDDPNFDANFRAYEGVEVKHGHEMTVYHFAPHGNNFLNLSESPRLALERKMASISDKLPILKQFSNVSREDRQKIQEQQVNLIDMMAAMISQKDDGGHAD